ncbi:hypothetical protein SAMN02745121_03917 [Nannocystis exedens]|uniref:Uncharacterized protein n=1 Tax=Nannocystis exedens TaxID=54 RepID=A0A1I1ZS10_9BACT|nr:hypothetical protein [Nannocystis exedens]PCC75357.1 hypothetical protein NAEX_08467 [Nannocystis exedens]SFE34188.1 hypothetical protein SAMN02745121_03917 [Nannocystis exedens]
MKCVAPWSRVVLSGLGWVCAPLLAACGGEEDPRPLPIGPVQQVSYEVIPTPLYELGMLDLTLENASYEQREAFTIAVRDAMLPDVVALVGLADAMLDTELTPGGFQRVTNPSLQTRLMASGAEVESLAAALGYVFSQWSVLVADFAAEDGGTGYAVVSFDVAEVDPELGQAFFDHAADVDAGLGGGYFAFDSEVIYLNLRGSDGEPYSGLDDDSFVAALEEAADSFAPYKAALAQAGEAAVILVENDWKTAPAGEEFLEVLDPLGEAALGDLAALQEEHVARFKAAVEQYGWE